MRFCVRDSLATSVAIEIDTSLPSARLVRVFEQLKAERGLPDVLRTDNGPEFLGVCFTTWCKDNGIMIDYIEPGKHNQNAHIERFNRSYRTEVLDTWLFKDLEEVREMTWVWILEYNEIRDHDSLGGMTSFEVLDTTAILTIVATNIPLKASSYIKHEYLNNHTIMA